MKSLADEELDLRQSADYLRVSYRTVRRFLKAGLPHIRYNERVLRCRKGDLDDWRERHRVRLPSGR